MKAGRLTGRINETQVWFYTLVKIWDIRILPSWWILTALQTRQEEHDQRTEAVSIQQCKRCLSQPPRPAAPRREDGVTWGWSAARRFAEAAAAARRNCRRTAAFGLTEVSSIRRSHLQGSDGGSRCTVRVTYKTLPTEEGDTAKTNCTLP